MKGEIDDEGTAHQAGWQSRRGVLFQAMTEQDEIDFAIACEVLQNGRGTESASAVKRVGRFR